ncbi:ester cyclase [uncultured Roseobacter sp.]|uniref:ester cyclase n=1 Tax=uncultured Roseobacter sp. TaxID=114847 RepID=UPI002638EC8E|nr:ester cyclase [uncultured Roseobacter sp.]
MDRSVVTAAAAVLAMATAASDANAQDRTPVETQNVETVLRLFEDGWGARDGWRDIWRGTMAPEVRSFFHSQPAVEGIEEAIAFNAGLFDGFPELAVSVEDVMAEGDSVVVRARLTGTQDGPFLGAPPSGQPVDVPDVTLFTLANGKVVEMRYFTDLLAVMTAIGAGPRD